MRRLFQSTTFRISGGLALTGIILITLAIEADTLGLDLTPGFGLAQILEFLIGVTLLTVAGFYVLVKQRPAGQSVSLPGDIGMRLGLTGLLACYVAGLADLVGVGTHNGERFERPFLGPLQITGILIGVVMVVVGMFLLWWGCRGSTGNEGSADPEPQPDSAS